MRFGAVSLESRVVFSVRPICCLRFALSLLVIPLARADSGAPANAGDPAAAAPKPLFGRDLPTPDPGGLRARLADQGIVLGLLYTGEVFGNPVGGYRRGAVYDGLLTTGLDVDFDKLARVRGLKLHALTYYPHGASGTDKYARDLGRFSNIDSFDTVRLFELWLEASVFDNAINLRAGQVAADAEFATTQGGALFVSSNFGALPIISLNVPAPIYPQAAPGARLRLNSPDARFYAQAGVYAGNPDADRLGDPSPGFRAGTAYNDHGIRFPISGNQGVFSVYEVGFLLNQAKDARGLPGAYRFGGFFHTDTFSDLRLASDGRSLADPRSTGRPRDHGGNGGLYVVADQVVHRFPGAPGGRRADVSQTASAPVGNAGDSPLGATGTALPSGPELRVFGRLGLAPWEDRSRADFYAEVGFNYRGLFPGRGQDVLGVGVTYTDLSGDLRRAARDANRFAGTRDDALPDHETVLEITYQANLAPWLSLQPDLQAVFHPGGSACYGDALILGARTVVTF